MTRVLAAALLLAGGCASGPPLEGVRRLPPAVARDRVQSRQALLVCAYEKARCQGTHLAGSITLEDLEPRLAALPREQEIILFCG
jgi:hypothetical protein